MKVTELQQRLLRESFSKAHEVLTEVKREKLKGVSLAWMKRLEEIVQNFESVLMDVRV